VSQLQRTMCFFTGIFLMTAFAGCSGDKNRKTAGRFIDDSVITSEVAAGMLREPMLKKVRIDVESFRGVVLLSGFVDSSQASGRAVKIAKSVHGVNAVKNSIVVK